MTWRENAVPETASGRCRAVDDSWSQCCRMAAVPHDHITSVDFLGRAGETGPTICAGRPQPVHEPVHDEPVLPDVPTPPPDHVPTAPPDADHVIDAAPSVHRFERFPVDHETARRQAGEGVGY